MARQKADLAHRILAGLIDGLISAVPALIPFIGALVATVYVLTRDALLYEITKQDEWKNRSIGKKLLHVEVATTSGITVGWATSIKRNAPLAIGVFVTLIPVFGWTAGPIICFVLYGIEIFLVLTDRRGRRFGDRWADTAVIDNVVASIAVDGAQGIVNTVADDANGVGVDR